MTLEQIIYDLRTILEMSKITNNSRFEDEHIEKKITEYRAIAIQDEYKLTKDVVPVWLSPLGKFLFEKVNSADENLGINTSVCFGKKTLPPVVNLPNNLGYYYLSAPAKQGRLYLVPREILMLMIQLGDDRLQHYIYGFIEHNSLFVYPYISEGNASLIAEDPRQCMMFRTERILSGNIQIGISYTVYSASIVYNTIIYNTGDVFIGVIGVKTYTGTGYVKLTTLTSNYGYSDEYPIDAAMAEKCIIKILTTDFQIEGKMIADLVQDSQDQLAILKNYENFKPK
jgi:hypothetical protein